MREHSVISGHARIQSLHPRSASVITSVSRCLVSVVHGLRSVIQVVSLTVIHIDLHPRPTNIAPSASNRRATVVLHRMPHKLMEALPVDRANIRCVFRGLETGFRAHCNRIGSLCRCLPSRAGTLRWSRFGSRMIRYSGHPEWVGAMCGWKARGGRPQRLPCTLPSRKAWPNPASPASRTY